MEVLPAALLVWLVGGAASALVLRLGGVAGRRLALFTVALAPGVGCGLGSLAFFAAVVTGIEPPGVVPFVTVLAVGGALFLVAVRRVKTARDPAGAGSLPGPIPVLAWSALAVSLFVGGAALLRLLQGWPEGTWDAVAIWNVRARFLFFGGEEVADLLGRVDPSSHPHYPLLLPGAVAGQYAMVGGEDAWVSRWIALGFVIGLAVLAFAVAAESRVRGAGALAAAFVVGTPLVWLWGASQVADVPLAYLFLAALAILSSQLGGYPREPLSPFLGGFFLGMLAWSKNEGLVIAGLLAGLFALWLIFSPSPLDGRRRWRIAAVVAGGAVPGLGATLLFKSLWAPESGLETFLMGSWQERIAAPDRWWMPIEAILGRWIPVETSYDWSVSWTVLVLAMLLLWLAAGRRHGPWFAFWSLAIFLVVLSWVPIFAVTPYDPTWHIHSSLDRLLLQVMPATAVGVVLAAALLAAGGRPWAKARSSR